jgi:hypothetical protein
MTALLETEQLCISPPLIPHALCDRREDLSPVEAVVEAFTELSGEQQRQAFDEISRYYANATIAY